MALCMTCSRGDSVKHSCGSLPGTPSASRSTLDMAASMEAAVNMHGNSLQAMSHARVPGLNIPAPPAASMECTYQIPLPGSATEAAHLARQQQWLQEPSARSMEGESDDSPGESTCVCAAGLMSARASRGPPVTAPHRTATGAVQARAVISRCPAGSRCHGSAPSAARACRCVPLAGLSGVRRCQRHLCAVWATVWRISR
jgi:hypothetical protein